MLRIIAGEQRGKKLELPPRDLVRPTTDRVRGAIFNMLRLLIEGRPGMDLFAGSGALGLEALSRGARHITFVEADPKISTILRRNVKHLSYDDRSRVVTTDVFRWAERQADRPSDPAIVLIAPPYAYFEDRLADLQRLWTTIVEQFPADTAIVMQAPKKFDAGHLPGGQDWELRRYGESTVVICQTCRN